MNGKNQDNRSSASYDALVEKRLSEKTERARLDQEYRSKRGNTDLSERWFIRYPLALCILVLAFVFFKMWLEGFKVQGVLHLFVNPVTPIIMAILAFCTAWELTLIAVFFAIAYFIFIGVAALPISVAVIIGFVILSYFTYKSKA